MTDEAGSFLGERIAFHRRRRGLSQREFAAEMGRSESWVSQVERGVRPVDRIPVRQRIADVLGIPLSDLEGGTAGATEPDAAEGERSPELDRLRLVLTGHPALTRLMDDETPPPAVDTKQIRRDADELGQLMHSSKFSELGPRLAETIPQLEAVLRPTKDRRQQVVRESLARTYQVAAALLARMRESDAAWVAAERAISVAERLDDPLTVISGHFRMAHAFLGLDQLDQARHAAEIAVDALRPRVKEPDCAPEALSLYGAMDLVLAVTSARESDRVASRSHLQEARQVARRIGEDRNDYGTEFGPTNVEIHAVSIAVEVGDAGEALDLAQAVDVTRLSPERQARYYVDLAQAHTQRRHVGEALHAMLTAEHLAPEQIMSHPIARDTIRDLINLTGRRAPPELRDLASRAAVL